MNKLKKKNRKERKRKEKRLGPADQKLIPLLHWDIDIQWMSVTKTIITVL